MNLGYFLFPDALHIWIHFWSVWIRLRMKLKLLGWKWTRNGKEWIQTQYIPEYIMKIFYPINACCLAYISVNPWADRRPLRRHFFERLAHESCLGMWWFLQSKRGGGARWSVFWPPGKVHLIPITTQAHWVLKESQVYKTTSGYRVQYISGCS